MEPTPQPIIELVKPTGGQNRSTIELRNFKQLDDALGRDVLNAFCRCFVHADRLTSTISCIYASQEQHGPTSVGFERDLNTMIWFTVGTLRELALAIQAARSGLARKGRLNPTSEPWTKLRALEGRWEATAFYREKRDVAAFHVDVDVINRGLDEIQKEMRDVTLSRHDSPRAVDSHLALGMLALHNGLELDLDKYRKFLEAVNEDHSAAVNAIQEAFIDAARASGVRFGDE